MIPSQWLLVVSLFAGVSGCDRQSSDPAPPPSQLTPQDRFDRVVESMREQLEDHGNSGSVGRITIRDSAGVGSTSYTYRVDASPKVVPPQEEGGPYLANIKVTFESSYSASRSTAAEEEEEAEKKEEQASNQSPTVDELLGASGPDILDPELVPDLPTESNGPAPFRPEFPTETGPAIQVTVYQLEYHNDKWRFAIPPPHDAPKSSNDAMRRALKRQG
ncbi:MAG: hypothetical protein ACR2NU_06765 [Aeoliella sp.]